MKKYNKCKICGKPVIAPFNPDTHIVCRAIAVAEKALKIDTKDINLPS